MRYIKTIKGRTNDLVQHANGRKLQLRNSKIPNGIVGISQFRYIQESIDEISILLVKDPLNDQFSKKEIEEFFEKKVEELYGYREYRLTFKWMDEIPSG